MRVIDSGTGRVMRVGNSVMRCMNGVCCNRVTMLTHVSRYRTPIEGECYLLGKIFGWETVAAVQHPAHVKW